MGPKITRHAFVRHRTKRTPCLSSVLSTKLSFGTTFTSLSACNCDIFSKNIHTYIQSYKHDLNTFLSIVWLRLHAFGAQPPSEQTSLRRTTAVRLCWSKAAFHNCRRAFIVSEPKNWFLIQTFGLNLSLQFPLLRIFGFAVFRYYGFSAFHFYSFSVFQLSVLAISSFRFYEFRFFEFRSGSAGHVFALRFLIFEFSSFQF